MHYNESSHVHTYSRHTGTERHEREREREVHRSPKWLAPIAHSTRARFNARTHHILPVSTSLSPLVHRTYKFCRCCRFFCLLVQYVVLSVARSSFSLAFCVCVSHDRIVACFRLPLPSRLSLFHSLSVLDSLALAPSFFSSH